MDLRIFFVLLFSLENKQTNKKKKIRKIKHMNSIDKMTKDDFFKQFTENI